MAKVDAVAVHRVLEALAGPQLERSGLVFGPIWFWMHNGDEIDGAIADLLWRCLEARPELPNAHAQYEVDEVAARLVPINPDRGFALLERVLRAPYNHKAWEPLRIGQRHEFWAQLCTIDRARALQIALEAISDGSWTLGSHELDEVIDLKRDHDILLSYAERGEKEAATVAETLAKRPDGFWPLAFALIERYPGSEPVLGRLAWALEELGGVIRGPLSAHLEKCLAEAERALSEENPPPAGKAWLEERINSLRQRIETERKREANERVNW